MSSNSPDMLAKDRNVVQSSALDAASQSHTRARTAPHADPIVSDEEDNEERDEALRKEIVSVAKEDPDFPKWKRRIIHGVWITLAIFLAWLSNIILNIIYFNSKINLVFFILGCISSSGFFGIFLYLNFYTYYIQKRVVDFKKWRLTAPKAIPIATVLGLVSTIFFMVAFWPLYGWFCFPLFFVWTMGVLTILSFF